MTHTLLVCQSLPPQLDPDLAFVGLVPDDLSWRARALRAEAEIAAIRNRVWKSRIPGLTPCNPSITLLVSGAGCIRQDTDHGRRP